MALRPMPSPRDTNLAKLFLPANPKAAYDAALPEDAKAALLEFLRDKLSTEDHAAFAKMLEADTDAAMDDGGPEPFAGMPLPGGGKAMDSRRRSFAERYPNAARIKVSP